MDFDKSKLSTNTGIILKVMEGRSGHFHAHVHLPSTLLATPAPGWDVAGLLGCLPELCCGLSTRKAGLGLQPAWPNTTSLPHRQCGDVASRSPCPEIPGLLLQPLQSGEGAWHAPGDLGDACGRGGLPVYKGPMKHLT